MMQTNLNNWDFINAQIQRSNIKRMDWKNLLGHSLTEEITIHRNNNLNPENIFKVIKSKLLLAGFDDLETLRKLKISVYARCGEQKAFDNRRRI